MRIRKKIRLPDRTVCGLGRELLKTPELLDQTEDYTGCGSKKKPEIFNIGKEVAAKKNPKCMRSFLLPQSTFGGFLAATSQPTSTKPLFQGV